MVSQKGTRDAGSLLVGGGDDRPTFFELIAADKLVPWLRAALVYSVGVLVSRRPSLARLLDHEDEAFALFMLLVVGTASPRATGPWQRACTACRGRARARSRAPRTEPASRREPRESAARRITKAQRIASVALLAGVPYARAKLDIFAARLARARGLEHATDADAVAGAILADAGGGTREGTSEGPLASLERAAAAEASPAARGAGRRARSGGFTASARARSRAFPRRR